MLINRTTIEDVDLSVPCVKIEPDHPIGSAVILHGYGGSKEEMLGLAWRIAELGFVACAVDLRGHGENPLPLDDRIAEDVKAAIEYCRSFGKVVAIGHSLGGRLALTSEADFAIGISPAIGREFGPQTHEILKRMRSYRVKERIPGKVFEILEKIPDFEPSVEKKTSVIFGERDVPEIVASCRRLEHDGMKGSEVKEALHGDIFLLEKTLGAVKTQLEEWNLV